MTPYKRNSRLSPTLVAMFAMMFISLTGGCGGQDKGDTVQTVSNKQPAPQVKPDPEQIAALVAGNTGFAFDLQRELFDPKQNLFYSPWSISQALAMTYAGARSETERQMTGVVHFALPQALLHPSFHAAGRVLNERDENDTGSFQLQITNAMWAQRDFPILASYLNIVTPYYNAPVRPVDFLQSEETRGLINRWGSDQTEGRIGELIPPGVINGETALVLTNAVYFKAAWKTAFRQHSRYRGEFQLLDGSKTVLPMMAQVAQFAYNEQPGIQIIELPYEGERFSMVVLLPDTGAFESFLTELDATRLSSLLDNLKPTTVSLEMPPFSSSHNYILKETLQKMGMVEAFQEADFSGITGTRELFIRDVCHSAFISVDESGTEAAAGTAVVIERKGAPRPDVRIKLNRPFIYIIREKTTGTILFLGHFVNPN